MRVGLFSYGTSEATSGIGRYTVEVARSMRRLDPGLELIVINPTPASTLPWYDEFETYPVPRLRRLAAAATLGNWELHRAARALRLDILHDPCGIAPFLVRGGSYRRVTTIHDAVPFVHAETQPFATRLVFQTLVRAARWSADAVVTVSDSAADDLATHAHIPRRKLFVAPNGTTPAPAVPPETARAVLDRLGIAGPFLLMVGTSNARKNVARSVDAFTAIADEKTQLVIVGGAMADELARKVAGDRRIVATGQADDDVLAALYSAARALVYPSLYEGFGLPALEAMAHGAPVIAANTSALPEVVGDAGLLVDPTSTADIAAAMKRLLDDDDLHDSLAARGRVRAATFTWDRTAAATLAVYEHVVEGRAAHRHVTDRDRS